MIASVESLAGKRLTVTSPEALDAAVAECVRLKIKRTALRAEADTEVAALEKRYQARLTKLDDAIAAGEAEVQAYCAAHGKELFGEKKSRGGVSSKPKVASAVSRALKLAWGRVYVRQPEPKPDKEALLADREKLTPEQQTALGVQFCQDEQFFIRPKPETAQE